jgi:hypothetical protein
MDQVKTYSNNLLKIEIKEDEKSLIAKWTGKSTDREPGKFITPILMDTIKEASDKKLRVVMDFRELSYMNSSTITPLIKILERAKRGDTHISVLYNKALHWQNLSFSALEIFTTEDQRVEIIGL